MACSPCCGPATVAPSSARSTACDTLFRKLRAAFPGARLRVRLDGGFAGNDLLAFLEAQGVEYVVALGRNRRLDKRAQRLMGKARLRAKTRGETAHVYGETCYAAAKWKRRRRVIIKAEVVCHPDRAPKNNPRFVVTNLPHTPQHVYEIYPARGRYREPHQGAQGRPGPGSAELLALRGQSVSAPAHPGRLHPGAGGARLRGGDGACHGPGHDAARAAAQSRGWVERSVRRIVLHFPARLLPVAAHLAPAGARRRRHALRTRARWSSAGSRTTCLCRADYPSARSAAAGPSGDSSHRSGPRRHLCAPRRASCRPCRRSFPQLRAFTHKAG